MATKKKVTTTCSQAGKKATKSGSAKSRSKAAGVLASKLCCKTKGNSKKCVNKVR
ncbi:MAG: hypothetical protein WCI04_07075 [archaeon]